MANPAELLYRQLKAWDLAGSQQNAEQRRALNKDLTMAIRRHEAALSNLRAVGELLDEAEKLELMPSDVIELYRGYLPAWGRMVLSYPDGWRNIYYFDSPSMQMLSTLGHQLDPLVRKLPTDAADAFEKALDEVLTALKDDSSIELNVKKYMLGLIIHMKLVIEEYRLNMRGDYDLFRAATLLKTSIDTAYEATDEDHKGMWARLKELFTWKDVTKAALELSPTIAAMITESGG
ncbi:hypothetical protein P5V78_02130 [Mycobacteroides abscessus subsp. abscessus]|uniref:Uncharacterized protein n=1 Tax=Mycobacterium phage phiT46-1 TaxID=2775045 RepID=A0A7T1X3B6_9CAUD|nr:hypothetical protein [Mycobacteroides abscessus]YP_010050679.1 hypothetical protein KDJ10_gp56 [Mycobacterium phage phiT46-1]QSM03147.1 hypothetical protein PROPHIGD24-2_21 [Mycobacterium phage prophiGD24-2]QSM03481.1 hypothetical protein PROPHIGD21-3_21 [Mycobacterium phage prophiGD21-3]WJJ56729.1 hypothetical protein PROPHIT461_21 [Mycobacterium phage prophiT46-1]MBN7400025.1 hypothetical protein [Mycobacteroides abscessus subsp. abscessus]MDB2219642.1 hypothetical protein [Mycobacteroid